MIHLCECLTEFVDVNQKARQVYQFSPVQKWKNKMVCAHPKKKKEQVCDQNHARRPSNKYEITAQCSQTFYSRQNNLKVFKYCCFSVKVNCWCLPLFFSCSIPINCKEGKLCFRRSKWLAMWLSSSYKGSKCYFLYH